MLRIMNEEKTVQVQKGDRMTCHVSKEYTYFYISYYWVNFVECVNRTSNTSWLECTITYAGIFNLFVIACPSNETYILLMYETEKGKKKLHKIII